MNPRRSLEVHLLPDLVARERLRQGIVVVIDVLRATTTMVCALAAGCRNIVPVESVEEAHRLAEELSRSQCLLLGERQGVRIDGFDLGNSPGECTPKVCRDRTLICTTTNGTRAILHAGDAKRVVLGSFVNFSAVCEELRRTDLPIHLLCAGQNGQVALEDVLFAGAVVEFLADRLDAELNDAARIAWDTHESHGQVLVSALELSAGGQLLLGLGFDADLKVAASVDRYGLVPEVFFDPLRITPARMHLESKHFRGESGLWT